MRSKIIESKETCSNKCENCRVKADCYCWVFSVLMHFINLPKKGVTCTNFLLESVKELVSTEHVLGNSAVIFHKWDDTGCEFEWDKYSCD